MAASRRSTLGAGMGALPDAIQATYAQRAWTSGPIWPSCPELLAEVVAAVALAQGGLEQLAGGGVRQLRHDQRRVRCRPGSYPTLKDGEQVRRLEAAARLGHYQQQRPLAPARMLGSDDRGLGD